MDAEVQQQYLEAEQAYGDGDFLRAERLAKSLLQQLEPLPDQGAGRDAALAWRAFVALLLGHIHFHGLQQPTDATAHYQLVLNSQPPDTLKDLALQGLERCRQQAALASRAPSGPPEPETPALTSASVAALIRDPFLREGPSSPPSERGPITSATPWLAPRASANPEPSPALPPPNQQTERETATTAVAEASDSESSTASFKTTTALPDTKEVPDDSEQDSEQDLETPRETSPPVPPLDLSPWLLRRTIHNDALGGRSVANTGSPGQAP